MLTSELRKLSIDEGMLGLGGLQCSAALSPVSVAVKFANYDA